MRHSDKNDKIPSEGFCHFVNLRKEKIIFTSAGLIITCYGG